MVELAVIEDLQRRVEALEKAHNANTGSLKWISATLGQVAGEVAALREETSKGFERVNGDVAGLRRDMPAIVAEAMRDVLKNQGQ